VRGTISPLDFIPAAEESGAIVEIGAWVLREACAQVARWNQAFALDLQLGVNVSVRQLEVDGFASAVRQVLAATGISASRLTLEVTESALARETGAVLATLAELDRDGVRLAIDDFGTGYSSFARLERLPVGMLKIDRSLTARMSSARGLAVMRGLLSMADAMGLTALVEGVETQDEARQLGALGVELAQGYRFSRPLNTSQLAGLLERATLPA
jgi:EAL domain-containing protein (putative c-di-GMP-specific phosphodiesterase class I)